MSVPRKIEYGSVGAIVKELGDLYSFIFDYKPALHEEHKLFVREFETKRGTAEEDKLKRCTECVQNSLKSHEECTRAAEACTDNILQVVKTSIELAKLQVQKEEHHMKQRSKLRSEKAIEELKALEQYELRYQEELKKLEESHANQVEALKAKYKV